MGFLAAMYAVNSSLPYDPIRSAGVVLPRALIYGLCGAAGGSVLGYLLRKFCYGF